MVDRVDGEGKLKLWDLKTESMIKLTSGSRRLSHGNDENS